MSNTYIVSVSGADYSPTGTSVANAWQGNDVSLVPETAGTINVGSVSLPFNTIFANSISASGVSGNFSSDLLPTTSGTINIGSDTLPFNNVFADPILQASDGSLWRLITDNAGVISGVSYP